MNTGHVVAALCAFCMLMLPAAQAQRRPLGLDQLFAADGRRPLRGGYAAHEQK